MSLAISIHPALPPMRQVNRRTEEHVGPCPFCGGEQRSDRFHVWLEPGNERFWCRQCNEKGPLSRLLNEDPRPLNPLPVRRGCRSRTPAATANHIPLYRQLYGAITLYAHENLLDECNPDPLNYLRGRGLNDQGIVRAQLGVLHHDPQALPTFLQQEYPELLPYAEEAGICLSDTRNQLRSHPNLCGCIVLPYMAQGEIVDLRTRKYPGKGYRSLAGGYSERGAVFPFAWDELQGSDTILLTEGEFKAIAVNQANQNATLAIPALAQPGLSYLREEWATQLYEQGVRRVILAYDSQPRPIKHGQLQLAPEEQWSVRHGLTLAAAGLQVQVLRLPLEGGAIKADLDEFLLQQGPSALERHISQAPLLTDYHKSLPQSLLAPLKKLLPSAYPSHRSRPYQIGGETPAATDTRPAPVPLDTARETIPELVRNHALNGAGFLVLAHLPGAGKGQGTTNGLQSYLQDAADPGQIVWTALRKDQLDDQSGLELIPLSGRNQSNCHKLNEANILTEKGYNVRDTLCRRRCPFVDRCKYLSQFGQEADFFAPQPLLQALSWWHHARVLVLDEFDPTQLIRVVKLTGSDLAAISRSSDDPNAQAIIRWLGTVLGDTLNRTLRGTLLLSALERAATAEGLHFATTLQAANAALPPAEDQSLLPGLPHGATIQDYLALPPGHLPTLLAQLAREHTRRLSGLPFTSRLEASGGLLQIYCRQEHLIAQLANPAQPKLILDATASTPLLRALFPDTPLQLIQPRLELHNNVVQVISQDWAKTGLQGGTAETRRERWYEAVSSYIRPDQPTLVVCTQACEQDLRTALAARGFEHVEVDHYGGLRGSNAYKGYDVILAQIYNPNLDAIICEGRALFADDAAPLDERIVVEERILNSKAGERWTIQVPTFADSRLAALLTIRREAELLQAALRGRPFDNPDAQITLLFGLPLPELVPTHIVEAAASADSNAGRQLAALEQICAAGRRLLDAGGHELTVQELAKEANVSVVTVRTHWAEVATRLCLRSLQQQRTAGMPKGGRRVYRVHVLLRRGRRVAALTRSGGIQAASAGGVNGESMCDQAHNMISITGLITHSVGKIARAKHVPRPCDSPTNQRRRRLLQWCQRC